MRVVYWQSQLFLVPRRGPGGHIKCCPAPKGAVCAPRINWLCQETRILVGFADPGSLFVTYWYFKQYMPPLRALYKSKSLRCSGVTKKTNIGFADGYICPKGSLPSLPACSCPFGAPSGIYCEDCPGGATTKGPLWASST